MMKTLNVSTTRLCALTALLFGQAAGFTRGDDQIVKFVADYEKEIMPEGVDWKEVGPDARAATLEFLAAQTKGNFEKIRTLKCSAQVHMMQWLSSDHIKSNYADRFPKKDYSDMYQTFDYTINVVIDQGQNAVFRDKVTSKMAFKRANGMGDLVKITGVEPNDNRSVVTNKSFIYFNPNRVTPSFHMLPPRPEAQNKRAAYCVPVAESQNQENGDLMDPRAYFGFDERTKFWGGPTLIAQALKGQGDAKKEVEARLDLGQGRNAAGEWFLVRFRFPTNTSDGTTLIATSVWSSHYGFNPTGYVAYKLKDGVSQRDARIDFRWEKIQGVFMPAVVKEILFTRLGGKLSYERQVKFSDYNLNSTLDPNQFGYSALGLRDGDLILNNIENVAYTYDDRTKGPLKLAAYGDSHVPEHRPLVSRSWPLFFAITGVAAVAAVAWYVRKFHSSQGKS